MQGVLGAGDNRVTTDREAACLVVAAVLPEALKGALLTLSEEPLYEAKKVHGKGFLLPTFPRVAAPLMRGLDSKGRLLRVPGTLGLLRVTDTLGLLRVTDTLSLDLHPEWAL